MKLDDLRKLDKDDVLSALGLATKRTASERLLGGLGLVAAGALVGAAAALLFAPTSGQGLREQLAQRFRTARERAADGEDATDVPQPAPSQGEART